MRTHAKLLFVATIFVATPLWAADVPVSYTVDSTALKASVAGTPLTFTLYSDASCTAVTGSNVINIDDVSIIEALKRTTPKNGTKPPKTTQLHAIVTGVTPAAASYMTVTGTGVTAVGGNCQLQVSGVAGPAGPAGPTLFQRETFSFVIVPAATTPVMLDSVTFTPPESGTAVVRARGYCNIDGLSGQDVGINISAGLTLASAFFANVSDWGVIKVPNGSPVTLHQMMWSSESEFAVTGGVATTIVLAGRHENGSGIDDCSGSILVEVYSGTLP